MDDLIVKQETDFRNHKLYIVRIQDHFAVGEFVDTLNTLLLAQGGKNV